MVEILDTAGTEQYSSMHQLYIDHGQAFVLVYAIDNKQSYRDIEPLLNQILDMKNTRNYPIIVVGNKSDREEYREVDRAQVERTARDVWLVPHIHTSAKEDHNVTEMFRKVLRMIKSYQDSQQAVKRKQQQTKGDGGCCVLLWGVSSRDFIALSHQFVTSGGKSSQEIVAAKLRFCDDKVFGSCLLISANCALRSLFDALSTLPSVITSEIILFHQF